MQWQKYREKSYRENLQNCKIQKYNIRTDFTIVLALEKEVQNEDFIQAYRQGYDMQRDDFVEPAGNFKLEEITSTQFIGYQNPGTNGFIIQAFA